MGFYAPGITVTTVKRDGEGVTPLRVQVRGKTGKGEWGMGNGKTVARNKVPGPRFEGRGTSDKATRHNMNRYGT